MTRAGLLTLHSIYIFAPYTWVVFSKGYLKLQKDGTRIKMKDLLNAQDWQDNTTEILGPGSISIRTL